MAKILVAEHNASIRAFLGNTLKSAGHAATFVDNALDAWRACGKEEYDVLIVDIVMPGIDGFVLAQKALQENPAIQVVFVTGFAAVAMDTYATPCYAPAPVTSRPFHLRNINARLRALSHHGFSDNDHGAAHAGTGAVIYADFAGKTFSRQQA